MPAGSRRVVRAAVIVLFISLAAPAAAIADGGAKCSASACKVYHEQSGPTSQQQQPPKQTSTGPNKDTGRKQSYARKSYSRVLARAGKDRAPLKNLLTGDAAIGTLRGGSGGGSPGLLGAAFDLGAGPAVLLAILLGTGLGLAARGRITGWIRKRSTP